MTIYDIANEAGVSISTVSRVLNNPQKVAPSTLARVREVLDRHNYFPNAMAQGLASNESKTIGILLSDIRNPHFSNSAYILEQMFFEWGYMTLVCSTGDSLSKKMDYVQAMASKKINGLIILGSMFNDIEISQLISASLPKIPIITSNLKLPVSNCYSVQVDHILGLHLAVEHLISRGFEDIYLVKTNDSTRKINGFIQACKHFQLPFDPATHILSTYSGPAGGRAVVDTLYPFEGRKAFVFTEDVTAAGAVSEFRRRNVAIPEQVGIIGHDNSTFSISCEPQMTTVDTHVSDMAAVIAKTLHDLLLGQKTGNNITIHPDLVIRSTT